MCQFFLHLPLRGAPRSCRPEGPSLGGGLPLPRQPPSLSPDPFKDECSWTAGVSQLGCKAEKGVL